FRAQLESLQSKLGEQHPQTLQAWNNLGGLLQARGDLEEAEQAFRTALAGYRDTQGPDHPGSIRCLNTLGQLLEVRARFAESEALLLEAESRLSQGVTVS